MTLRDRIRVRRLRRLRKRQARHLAGSPLREFVYLDEVSVYSLVASRTGPIATDYRDTTSTLLRSELEGTIGGNVGVAKSEVSSTIESSQTTEMQVVRKAVIQSTFRQLYQQERDSLALKVTDIGNAPSSVHDLDELRAAIGSRSECDGWIIDPSELKRGQMVEVEVELHADKLFGLTTAVAAVVEMVQGNSELSTSIGPDDVRQVTEINRLLQRLLVGLVPLRGRAVHYRSVVVDGKEWLVHQSLVTQMAEPDVRVDPVFLVGVAERHLFWKDLRRILFSRSRYLVLARLGKDGVQADWSPVKSLGVLEEAIPGLAKPIAEAIQAMPTMITTADRDEADMPVEAGRMLTTLIRYGGAIAAHHGHEYATVGEDLVVSGAIDVARLGSLEQFDERRRAFAAVAAHVVDRFQIELEPEWAAQLRQQLQTEAGVWPPTESRTTFIAEPNPALLEGAATAPSSFAEVPRYLDAEIVGVYW